MQPELIVTPFAQNAPDTSVDDIPEALNPATDPPQAASWEMGFPALTMTPLAAGGIPPRGQSFNGVLQDISEHLVFMGGGGQYKWSDKYVSAKGGYSVGDVIQSDDGLNSYVSLVDNNTTNFNTSPSSIGTLWRGWAGRSGGLNEFGLIGPAVIAVGGSFTYKISPYSNVGVTWSATATVGTVSISGDTITLTIASGEPANSTVLTVTRSDGATSDFPLAIGSQSIAKPSLLSPANGAIDVPLGPTLTASAFATFPVGADTHLNTDWRIRTYPAGAVVWQSLANATNKTTIPVPDNTLPLNTQLQADVRYRGATLPVSAWSEPSVFTTTNQSILTPSITSPLNGATGIGRTPTFTSSAFATNPPGADTHASTDWRLKNSLGQIIWSSTSDAVNKLSITLPSGVLVTSSQYTIEDRYNGNVLQPSQWSPVVSFTTAATFDYGSYLFTASGSSSVTPRMYGRDVDTFNLLPVQPVFPSADAYSGSFTQDSMYFATTLLTSPYIAIYKRSGDVFTRLANPTFLPTGPAFKCTFSPDGKYLLVAFGGSSNPYALIYKRSGDVFTRLNILSLSSSGSCCAISDTNAYIAVNTTNTLQFGAVHKLQNDTLTSVLSIRGGQGLAFSKNADYFACGGNNSGGSAFLNIYKRTGDSFARLPDPAIMPTAATVNIAFAENGLYLAVAAGTAGLLIYKRSGDTFVNLASPSVLPAGSVSGVSFSQDGLYLSVGSGASPYVTIYKRSGDVFAKLANPAVLPTGSVTDLAISPPSLG